MKNVLEFGFVYESIHKIIKIQYYAKITQYYGKISLYKTIYFGQFSQDKAYSIFISLKMDSYLKRVSKTFFNDDIFGEHEYFSSYSENKI